MISWQPTVTVVVPAYNAAATIEDCVRSLLALRYPRERLELLVVDNGSGDRTVGALRPYGQWITVLHEPRRGPAAARNAGVRRAASEVIAFTDADCVVDPGWLLPLVAALEEPAVGVAGGEIRALPPANDVERFGETIHDHRLAIEALAPPYAITMSWASRRVVLLELGGFDECCRRAEDVELSYRMLQAGYQLVFAPGSLVYHRNEHDLAGLFSEGFAHGLHGVRVRKRHAAFLRQFGHSQVNARAWAELGRSLVRWAQGSDDRRSRCEAAFNAGKKAGKLAGSVRFAHCDL